MCMFFNYKKKKIFTVFLSPGYVMEDDWNPGNGRNRLWISLGLTSFGRPRTKSVRTGSPFPYLDSWGWWLFISKYKLGTGMVFFFSKCILFYPTASIQQRVKERQMEKKVVENNEKLKSFFFFFVTGR